MHLADIVNRLLIATFSYLIIEHTVLIAERVTADAVRCLARSL
jgi:hypothetical protein